MHPKNLSVKNFTYQLPEEKIARFPLAERDRAKLLIYKDQDIKEDIYLNLTDHLPENAMLVFNNTRVVEARVLFRKQTGALIEIFALEPDSRYHDITTGMMTRGEVWWHCLIGGAGKWKHGQVLEKEATHPNGAIKLTAEIVERTPADFIIRFRWHPGTLSFAEVLHVAGVMPIPPYLKRASQPDDLERYQTIYASQDGSVAAPTAGLHFTEEVFRRIKAKGVATAYLTLHVGAGTFMPVKADRLEGHHMHAEFMDVELKFIRDIINHRGNIMAVGTTSVRTLESLYWMGLKCFLKPEITAEELEITQWEVYEELEQHAIPPDDALSSLITWMQTQGIHRLITKTQILVAPGYKVKIISGLLTNFHQPDSTLLLLVAALIGNDWHKVYEYALNNDFRFLSFGDGCLLYPHQVSTMAYQ